MDEYQIPERANKVEAERERERGRVQRSTVHFAKARWRGQLWMLHAPSACQAVTCTQHADAITSACLYSSGQSELYILFPHLTFSFFFFFQSVAGIEGEFVRRSNQIWCCLSGFVQRLFTRPRRDSYRLSWLLTRREELQKFPFSVH